MSEKQTKRRAPRGAYSITQHKGTKQYVTTIPPHIAGPLYEANLAVTFEVVEDGILMRPVPMDEPVAEPADEALALVARIRGVQA
jgi:hypothetical protein